MKVNKNSYKTMTNQELEKTQKKLEEEIKNIKHRLFPQPSEKNPIKNTEIVEKKEENKGIEEKKPNSPKNLNSSSNADNGIEQKAEKIFSSLQELLNKVANFNFIQNDKDVDTALQLFNFLYSYSSYKELLKEKKKETNITGYVADGIINFAGRTGKNTLSVVNKVIEGGKGKITDKLNQSFRKTMDFSNIDLHLEEKEEDENQSEKKEIQPQEEKASNHKDGGFLGELEKLLKMGILAQNLQQKLSSVNDLNLQDLKKTTEDMEIIGTFIKLREKEDNSDLSIEKIMGGALKAVKKIFTDKEMTSDLKSIEEKLEIISASFAVFLPPPKLEKTKSSVNVKNNNEEPKIESKSKNDKNNALNNFKTTIGEISLPITALTDGSDISYRSKLAIFRYFIKAQEFNYKRYLLKSKNTIKTKDSNNNKENKGSSLKEIKKICKIEDECQFVAFKEILAAATAKKSTEENTSFLDVINFKKHLEVFAGIGNGIVGEENFKTYSQEMRFNRILAGFEELYSELSKDVIDVKKVKDKRDEITNYIVWSMNDGKDYALDSDVCTAFLILVSIGDDLPNLKARYDNLQNKMDKELLELNKKNKKNKKKEVEANDLKFSGLTKAMGKIFSLALLNRLEFDEQEAIKKSTLFPGDKKKQLQNLQERFDGNVDIESTSQNSNSSGSSNENLTSSTSNSSTNSLSSSRISLNPNTSLNLNLLANSNSQNDLTAPKTPNTGSTDHQNDFFLRVNAAFKKKTKGYKKQVVDEGLDTLNNVNEYKDVHDLLSSTYKYLYPNDHVVFLDRNIENIEKTAKNEVEKIIERKCGNSKNKTNSNQNQTSKNFNTITEAIVEQKEGKITDQKGKHNLFKEKMVTVESIKEKINNKRKGYEECFEGKKISKKEKFNPYGREIILLQQELDRTRKELESMEKELGNNSQNNNNNKSSLKTYSSLSKTKRELEKRIKQYKLTTNEDSDLLLKGFTCAAELHGAIESLWGDKNFKNNNGLKQLKYEYLYQLWFRLELLHKTLDGPGDTWHKYLNTVELFKAFLKMQKAVSNWEQENNIKQNDSVTKMVKACETFDEYIKSSVKKLLIENDGFTTDNNKEDLVDDLNDDISLNQVITQSPTSTTPTPRPIPTPREGDEHKEKEINENDGKSETAPAENNNENKNDINLNNNENSNHQNNMGINFDKIFNKILEKKKKEIKEKIEKQNAEKNIEEKKVENIVEKKEEENNGSSNQLQLQISQQPNQQISSPPNGETKITNSNIQPQTITSPQNQLQQQANQQPLQPLQTITNEIKIEEKKEEKKVEEKKKAESLNQPQSQTLQQTSQPIVQQHPLPSNTDNKNDNSIDQNENKRKIEEKIVEKVEDNNIENNKTATMNQTLQPQNNNNDIHDAPPPPNDSDIPEPPPLTDTPDTNDIIILLSQSNEISKTQSTNNTQAINKKSNLRESSSFLEDIQNKTNGNGKKIVYVNVTDESPKIARDTFYVIEGDGKNKAVMVLTNNGSVYIEKVDKINTKFISTSKENDSFKSLLKQDGEEYQRNIQQYKPDKKLLSTLTNWKLCLEVSTHREIKDISSGFGSKIGEGIFGGAKFNKDKLEPDGGIIKSKFFTPDFTLQDELIKKILKRRDDIEDSDSGSDSELEDEKNNVEEEKETAKEEKNEKKEIIAKPKSTTDDFVFYGSAEQLKNEGGLTAAMKKLFPADNNEKKEEKLNNEQKKEEKKEDKKEEKILLPSITPNPVTNSNNNNLNNSNDANGGSNPIPLIYNGPTNPNMIFTSLPPSKLGTEGGQQPGMNQQ